MLLHRTKPVGHKSNFGPIKSTSNDLAPTNVQMSKVGALTVGVLAVGALSIGALAIGALAIGRLVISRARIRRLEIDDLVVGRLHVTDTLETPSTPRTESDKAP